MSERAEPRSIGNAEPAVRRYKQLAAVNTEAVQAMRTEDAAKVEQLHRRLADSDRLLARAAQDERVARSSVQSHWESAVEELWNERWLALQPLPTPSTPPPGLTIAQCDAEVERTYTALCEALRRPGVLPRFGQRG